MAACQGQGGAGGDCGEPVQQDLQARGGEDGVPEEDHRGWAGEAGLARQAGAGAAGRHSGPQEAGEAEAGPGAAPAGVRQHGQVTMGTIYCTVWNVRVRIMCSRLNQSYSKNIFFKPTHITYMHDYFAVLLLKQTLNMYKTPTTKKWCHIYNKFFSLF